MADVPVPASQGISITSTTYNLPAIQNNLFASAGAASAAAKTATAADGVARYVFALVAVVQPPKTMVEVDPVTF